MINVTELSGYLTTETLKRSVSADNIYGETKFFHKNIKMGEYIIATPETAIMAAAKSAKQKGGDGIINLKVEFIYIHNKSGLKSGYNVSGMIIKRK